MQVAKQINGEVVISTIAAFYPNTSFSEEGPAQDFLDQEGIFFIDNELTFDPTEQKLLTVPPYIDGTVVRTKVVVQLTEQELMVMTMTKSGHLIDDFKREASRRLDEFAQSRGYDNIISVTTYMTSNNPDYVAEAHRAVFLRDEWWGTLTGIMNNVLTGARALPASFEELALELPELSWDNQRPAR